MGLKPQCRECFRTAGGPDPAPKSSGILLTPVKSDSSLVCDADATLLFTINHGSVGGAAWWLASGKFRHGASFVKHLHP